MKLVPRKLTLREARMIKGLSLKDTADRLGISVMELGNYEDDPSSMYVSTAVKLARIYKVSIDDLDFSHEVSAPHCVKNV